MTRCLPLAALLLLLCPLHRSEAQQVGTDLFAKDNLVAWCIVPFDAKKRGPAERAKMVARLGIQRVAYDWRAEHVPTFEQEIIEFKSLGIEFFAFWSWHDSMEPLIAKHRIHPQIWVTVPSPDLATQEERIAAAAKKLSKLAEKTKRLGLKLGLYNHGGWGGSPENMIAVCQRLRGQFNSEHVGIIYNFHHGHDQANRIAEAFIQMRPYLLCVNLNGMLDPKQFDVNDQKNKIRAIGSGTLEQSMIQGLLQSGYQGPIGILDHRNDLDSEVALRSNLQGLEQVRMRMKRE